MEYICSCSFGKDSNATILTALEHNEPLTRVVYVETIEHFDKRVDKYIELLRMQQAFDF